MIIQLRGTSGSGKTYTARSFMECYAPDIQICDIGGKTVAHCVYWEMQPVYLLGSYKNVCGGCDSISSQDMVCSLVRHFSQFGHVIFEGLIMSHLYARYAALADEMSEAGDVFTFAFMDTPLELCLERIVQRRITKGNYKELNPDNTIGKYESTHAVAEKLRKAGYNVVWINHKKTPVTQLISLLHKDNIPFEQSYREESFR